MVKRKTRVSSIPCEAVKKPSSPHCNPLGRKRQVLRWVARWLARPCGGPPGCTTTATIDHYCSYSWTSTQERNQIKAAEVVSKKQNEGKSHVLVPVSLHSPHQPDPFNKKSLLVGEAMQGPKQLESSRTHESSQHLTVGHSSSAPASDEMNTAGPARHGLLSWA